VSDAALDVEGGRAELASTDRPASAGPWIRVLIVDDSRSSGGPERRAGRHHDIEVVGTRSIRTSAREKIVRLRPDVDHARRRDAAHGRA
jgi:hypothetical protein